MRRFSGKANLLGAAFSLAVIAYVLATLDWQRMAATFRQINLLYVGLGFLVYLLNYVLRTLRFQALLDLKSARFQDLLGITQLYGMYLYLMPAKSGELSYPLLLKSRLGISLGSSAATLIAARFFDFAAIALLLPLALLAYWSQTPSWVRVSALTFSGLVLIVGVAALWWLGRSPYREAAAPQSPGVFNRLLAGLLSTAGHMRVIHARGRYGRLWALTLGVWLCVQTNFYLITLGLGVQLSFFQVVVISLIMVPLTLLPLQGFANLGTHEIGWVAAFRVFAMPQDTALNLAVGTHFILLVFILLLGGIGAALLSRGGASKSERVQL